MTIFNNTDSAKLHKLGYLAAAGGIALLGFAGLVVLEWRSAAYAFDIAPEGDPAKPWLYVATSAIFGLLAYVGMMVSGLLSRDQRKRYQTGSALAFWVALGCMTVPVSNLAASFSYDRLSKQWEYNRPTASRPAGSDAYQTALRKAQNDEGVYSDEEVALAQQVIQPPSHGRANGFEWLQAAFWNMLVMLAARSFAVPPPITDAERKAIEEAALAQLRSDRARKAAETRRRNAKGKKGAKPKSDPKVTPLFGARKA